MPVQIEPKADDARSHVLDRRREPLSARTESTTPASLRPWVAAVLEPRFSAEAAGGQPVRTTLDVALHRRLEAAFTGVEQGSGAVIDVSTGGIRALFSTLPHNAEPGLPTRHAATGLPEAMGSLAKPFTALAGLGAGVLKPKTEHVCEGFVDVGKRRFRCHGIHGALDLTRALVVSDNAFFFQVAAQLEHDQLVNVQDAFGLGRDVPVFANAPSGWVPTQDAFEGDGNVMRKAYTFNQAIGHGMRVTPLQVARAYAGLATGRLPKLTLRADAAGASTKVSSVDATHLALVRRAMEHVVTDHDGTAHFDDVAVGYAVAGKTGTANRPHVQGAGPAPTVGWFAGWAPADAPRVAFAFRIVGKIGRRTARRVLTADVAKEPSAAVSSAR